MQGTPPDCFIEAHDNLRLPLPRLAEISFGASESALTVLTDPALFEARGTRIAFTQRHGGVSQAPYGSLNLSTTVGDELDNVYTNRALLCELLSDNIDTTCLVMPNQVHGDLVLEIDNVSDAKAKASEGADGIVCALDDVPVLLCFADCVPVILVAPDGSFAVIHSGWRGAIDSISGIGLQKLAKLAHCNCSDINCYIGPHIGVCCYEVSAELIERFVEEFGPSCDAGHNHLDLGAAVTEALLRFGAHAQRIVEAQDCTSCCHDLYYSYRAEHGITGRHGAFAIRKGNS